MEYLATFLDFFLHIDKHLDVIVRSYGFWTYLILFLIVFCETGLVITPFLPGDSLLFAAGALAGRGSLDITYLCILFFIAAVTGDAVNYHIGKYLGPKVLERPNSKIFRKEWLDRTHSFYERYGGKTIIFARFVPIVRTFAPFLAGVGVMKYKDFIFYNIAGAVLWIGLFAVGGFLFGELEFVKKNFSVVILAIIVISIMPGVFEFIKAKRATSKS